MPRALRIEYPGAVYHVMNRGVRREPVFRDEFNRRRQVRIARRLRTETSMTMKWIARELHICT